MRRHQLAVGWLMRGIQKATEIFWETYEKAMMVGMLTGTDSGRHLVISGGYWGTHGCKGLGREKGDKDDYSFQLRCTDGHSYT